MTFLYPIFLLGGAAVLAPIIVHLLARPRYRPVEFPMVRFLLLGERQARARRRLANLLLLLMRCGAVGLVALLFAGPALVRHEAGQEPAVACYLGLDDSASMDFSDGGRTRFEEALDAAADYVRRAPEGATFRIYGLASGDASATLDASQAGAYLRHVRTVPRTARLDALLDAVKEAGRADPAPEVRVFVSSDFTPKVLEQLGKLRGSAEAAAVEHWQAGGDGANAAVVSVRAESVGDGELVVSAALANYGSAEARRTLTPVLDGRAAPPTDVALPAHVRRTCRLSVPLPHPAGAGFHALEVRLDGADGLAADDVYYLGVDLPQAQRRNTLVVGPRRQRFLVKTAADALSGLAGYGAIAVRERDATGPLTEDLRWADTVVWTGDYAALARAGEEVGRFARDGGRLVVFLHADAKPGDLGSSALPELLAAAPGAPAAGTMRLSVLPDVEAAADPLSPDGAARADLRSYRLGAVQVRAAFECRPLADARCLWSFDGGVGFLYWRRVGRGASLLVNASADESMGDLLRSPAAVAFVRYLMGPASEPRGYAFSCEESVALPATQDEEEQAGRGEKVWAVLPGGHYAEADVVGGIFAGRSPYETGWFRPLREPRRLAGVDLPEGETDTTPADETAVADALGRVFAVRPVEAQAAAPGADHERLRPVAAPVAWVLMGLVLAEAFLANRMRR